MNRLTLALAAACLIIFGFVATTWLQADSIPATTTAPKLPSTCIPVAKDQNRHEQYLALAKKSGIDLYFEGDSITDGWHTTGKAVWQKEFAGWNAANFGIGGDRTEHVLWRLQNGELDGVNPKVVVLMIGTNNWGAKPEDIAAGITAIINEIQKQSPTTKILLLAIFPRGEKALDGPKGVRGMLILVNDILAKQDFGKNVKYLDIGPKFLDPDNTLSKSLFPDGLHPNAKGYQIWADAIKPQLTEWLGAPAATAPATTAK